MDATSMLAGIALALSLLTLGGLVGAFLQIRNHTETAQRALRLAARARTEAKGGDATGLRERLAEVELQVAQLPTTWESIEARLAEMKDHADKQYRRAASARSYADRKERQLEGSDGDEDGDLSLFDGPGGEGAGMPAVPGGVGVDPSAGGQAVETPWYRNPYVLADMEI